VPGVSSVFGASAALGIEYTLPGISQTLIVTRAAGRTPVPEGQSLTSLATHGATLAILLSVGLADRVQEDLLASGLPPATPAAVVCDASWETERILPCTVSTLATTIREHEVRGRAIIVVGQVLDQASGDAHVRSCLYDPAFSHAFRNASDTHCREEGPCA